MNKRKDRISDHVSFARTGQVFLFLAASLISFAGIYWIFFLEPQINQHSRSQSALIAQSQSWILADAVEQENRMHLLAERIDEILILTDPTTETPYIHGISVEIEDQTTTISRGNTACADCFVIKIPLYAKLNHELIGLATFYSNNNLFNFLRDNIRNKIIISIIVILAFITIAWLTIWKLISRARIKDRNLATIFDSIPYPMIIVPAQLDRILYYNRSATRILDIEADTFETVKPEALFTDSVKFSDIRELANTSAFTFECGIHTRHQKDIWSLTTMAPVIYNKELCNIIAFADITATRDAREEINESRKRFAAIVDGLEDSVYVIRDSDGRIMFSNIETREVKEFETLCGTNTPTNIRGNLVTDQYTADDHGIITHEFHNSRNNRWYNSRQRMISWIDGQSVRLVTITDITKLIKSQLDLENEKQKAEKASRAKSDFLATMSHEIRTPMNGIIGMLNLLKRTPLTTEQTDYLETINASSEQLLLLLNDILDISKIESGKLLLEHSPFNLARLARDCMRLIESRAREKHLQLSIDIASNIPAELIGDEMRIRQILINLLGNAIKFTDHGFIRLGIAVSRQFRDRLRLLFTVSDSGIGIPEDKQTNLFEKFSQLDSSTSRKYGGSGLGLAICKQLVNAMGGEIGFESTPNKGSNFFFSLELPLIDASAVSSNLPPTATDLPSLHILIAEDNDINSYAAKSLLEQDGHRVNLAKNGEQAVNAVRNSAQIFDVILMDIHMPDVDGIEATRRIRELQDPQRQSIPVIALTANILQEDKQKCLAAGMNGFVSKPFSPEQLNRELLAVLHARMTTEQITK